MDMEQNKKEVTRILIVDDIDINVEILAGIIEAEGYEPLCALSVQEALDIMNQKMPQLILSDYSMPGMNGIEFCKLLKSNPRTREIPFIMITVADSGDDKKAAFSAGAVDFIPKPFERIEVVMRVNNQLNSYRIKQEMKDYNRMMHKMVAEQKKQMEKERENVLLALAKVLERRNAKMSHHMEQVGNNCRVLAQSLQLMPAYENQITDEFIEVIETAARLHDIGNLVIPDTMLHNEKPTKEERDELVKRHTEEGAGILEEISAENANSRFLNMAILIARYHHARWDGTGYPVGAKETEIPLAARIASVINDFDALLIGYRCDRAYSVEESLAIINERSGSYYEPGIVDVFNKVIKRLQTT